MILTAWAEHCHFMNSLKDRFLWVMSSQPNDSKKLQHRVLPANAEEPLVPQGGTHGPQSRASSRRDPPGGKGGCLPMWTEGQLTSDLRLEKVEGSGLQKSLHGTCLLPESLCDPHTGKECEIVFMFPSSRLSHCYWEIYPHSGFDCGCLESRKNKQTKT